MVNITIMKGQDISPWSIELENSIILERSKIYTSKKKETNCLKLPLITNSTQVNQTVVDSLIDQKSQIISPAEARSQRSDERKQELCLIEAKVKSKQSDHGEMKEKYCTVSISESDQILFDEFSLAQERNLVIDIIQESLRAEDIEKIRLRSRSVQQAYGINKQILQEMTLEVRRKMVQRPFPEISMVRIHEPDPYSFDKKMRSILKNEAHRTMVRRMEKQGTTKSASGMKIVRLLMILNCLSRQSQRVNGGMGTEG